MSETVIDLIRHGEPEGGSKYRGHHVDDPLSEKGWSQMWAAIGEQIPWQFIISSPLLRCCEFANALGERHDIPVAIDDRLKETGFGSWEGKTRAEVRQQNPKEYEGFYRDPVNCRPAGAENLDDFIARASSACDDVVQRYVGHHCLIVAHAGVIRAIVAHTLRAEPGALYRIEIDNAGLTRIGFDAGKVRLGFVNRAALP